ncbi:hypothetical protein BJ912DRAFT_608613 [Pholiota molesta]|nr:hypothetical protein BJ912DRAFT_608613 [Pholiota molesta]
MELRRSKRLQSQFNNANVGEASKRGRTKKSKTHLEDDAVESEKPAYWARGSLEKLVEMPLDVLFEIFGKLDPLDLLHISHATKALRAILMSRSSVSVWRSARSNVIGLPDCPDDLNEPQYATLVFVPRCSFCQKKVPDAQVFWYTRVRCCKEWKCVEPNFTKVRRMRSTNQDCPSPALLADWVPFVQLVPNFKQSKQEVFISQSVDDQWRHEYSAIKDLKSRHEWLLRTMEARYTIQQHACACERWHKAWLKGRNADTLRQILDRNAEIMGFIRKIGFEEELYKLPPIMFSPLDELDVQSLWDPSGPSIENSSALTSKLQELLTEELGESKRLREELEYRELLLSRKQFLSSIYNDGIKKLPLNSPSPTLAQFYRITEEHDLIDYSTAAEDALRVTFDEFMDIWRKFVDYKLTCRIEGACGSEYQFDRATVLDLATTFFRCVVCSPNLPMRHDQAIIHPCAEKVRYISGAKSQSQKAFYSVFGHALWCEPDPNWSTRFHSFDLKISDLDCLKIAPKIIERWGFDPRVTTARQMDELDPVFECRQCSSCEKGSATMTWVAALHHQHRSHGSSLPINTLRRLGEPKATEVREGIKYEQMKSNYQHKSKVVCPHCKSVVDNVTHYRKHLMETHGISKVKYEEVIFSLIVTISPVSAHHFYS